MAWNPHLVARVWNHMPWIHVFPAHVSQVMFYTVDKHLVVVVRPSAHDHVMMALV